MAISFEFKEGLFWIRFSGVVSNSDLMGILAPFDEAENKHAVMPHRITDLSEVTEMQIGFDDILTLASQRREKHFPNSFKSAIVAANQSQTGFARMFQTLNNNPQITVRIFADRPGALAWISS